MLEFDNQIHFWDENKNQLYDAVSGLYGLGLDIPSPSYTAQTVQVNGRGTITVDKKLNPRPITARFMTYVSGGYHDRLNQLFELYGLLGNGKEFYIEHYNHRNLIPLVLVWKCSLGDWEPDKIGMNITTFDIPMTCTSGMAETLLRHEESFTGNTFTLVNEGTVEVDPRMHDGFEIEFNGASTDLTITNETTGDVWKYNGETLATDQILIKGIRPLKNCTSILGDTNMNLISLAIGDNNFTVSGASADFELTIRTHFYYL